jgi:hypothetical protein
MPRCDTCRHYVATETQCRRFPPTIFLVGFDPKRNPLFVSSWPAVQAAIQSCGEYSALAVNQ